MKKYNFDLTGSLEDGTVIIVKGDFMVGVDVVTIDASGVEAPLFDGEHELADGTKFATVSGKITEIIPAEEASVVEPTPSVEVKQSAIVSTDVEEVTPVVTTELTYITKEEFEKFKMEFSREIIEAIVDSKLNAFNEAKTVREELNKVVKIEEPKTYREFVLQRIANLK